MELLALLLVFVVIVLIEECSYGGRWFRPMLDTKDRITGQTVIGDTIAQYFWDIYARSPSEGLRATMEAARAELADEIENLVDYGYADIAMQLDIDEDFVGEGLQQ